MRSKPSLQDDQKCCGTLCYFVMLFKNIFRRFTIPFFIFFSIVVVLLLSHRCYIRQCRGIDQGVLSRCVNIKLSLQGNERNAQNGRAVGPLYSFDTKYLNSEYVRSLHPTSEAGKFMNKSSDMIPSKFHRQIIRDVFFAFDDLWRLKLGRLYFLWGGTLLGAYRHAGRIPHDDDLDILVDEKYLSSFYSYLNGTNLTAVNFGRVRKVFFRNYSLSLKTRLGRWPCIDVGFYTFEQNGSRMKTLDQPLNALTTHYFPNNFLPFEGRLVPVPRCVIPALTEYYKTDFESKCCNHIYNHRLEKSRKGGSLCIKCYELHGVIPFTTWKRLNATHSQQFVLPPLSKKGDELNWEPGLVIPMPDCS